MTDNPQDYKVQKSYSYRLSQIEDVHHLARLWDISDSAVVQRAVDEFLAAHATELAVPLTQTPR